MPIYPMQRNYIVMNIDESVFCMPIYPVQGNYNLYILASGSIKQTQIMELQLKYP